MALVQIGKFVIRMSQINADYVEHVENVLHIMSGCSNLAQKEYKRRHNNVCLNIH